MVLIMLKQPMMDVSHFWLVTIGN